MNNEPLHPDLFGGETRIVEPKGPESAFRAFRRMFNYLHKGGTKAMCCGTCKHLEAWRQSKSWFKCDLQGGGSEASDIRKSSVCDKWTAQ